MSTYEKAALQGGLPDQSIVINDEGTSHASPAKASEKPAQVQRKVPRPGCKTRTLLDKLRSNAGEWVSLPDLSKATHLAAIHSGISTLRAGGWIIENRMERHPFNGGTEIHSFYKLEEETP